MVYELRLQSRFRGVWRLGLGEVKRVLSPVRF